MIAENFMVEYKTIIFHFFLSEGGLGAGCGLRAAGCGLRALLTVHRVDAASSQNVDKRTSLGM